VLLVVLYLIPLSLSLLGTHYGVYPLRRSECFFFCFSRRAKMEVLSMYDEKDYDGFIMAGVMVVLLVVFGFMAFA
jgi:hypothetical protein